MVLPLLDGSQAKQKSQNPRCCRGPCAPLRMQADKQEGVAGVSFPFHNKEGEGKKKKQIEREKEEGEQGRGPTAVGLQLSL